jgi:hypothetical protein
MSASQELTQGGTPRSAQIMKFREEVFERRPLPKVIATRTFAVGDRIIHQFLMDFSRELGRGSCRWTTDIDSFGITRQ